MSSSAENSSGGGDWVSVDVPISTSATSGIYSGVSIGGFSDGSFDTAATPTPGLTNSLQNTSSAISSVGTAVSNLTSSASGIFMLMAAGVAIYYFMKKKV